MLWQKEELIMTFRMYAGVRFNREISTETDAITVGGYEMYLIERFLDLWQCKI